MDKKNWDLFGIYAVALWSVVLVVMPSIHYFNAWSGAKLSGAGTSPKKIFLANAGALLPLGLMMWIAFVIPMLFVNITFIFQSLSDPFGWGWDFFGTANIPWHQFLPEYIPWFQSILILYGTYLSLRNLKRTWQKSADGNTNVFLLCLPEGIFLLLVSVIMIAFFAG